jgi:hypothetical protein
MTAAIIDYDTSLSTVLEHCIYTLTRVEAQPLTQDLAPAFVAFQKAWTKTEALELQHHVAVLKAVALVAAADDDLDAFVDRASNVLLSLTGNDRGAPLYKQYFGDKRPSDLKRPVLGAQLEAMRTWVPSLKAASQAPLAKLGQELEAKIAAADKAKTALATAQQETRVFRATGERRALIDQFNALRKDAYGKIAGLPHTHPDQNLPGNLAEHFFKRVSRAKDESEALSSVDLLAQISEAEASLSALRDRLKEVVAREEAEAKAREAAEAEDAELAELQKKRAAIEAEIAAKQAKRNR